MSDAHFQGQFEVELKYRVKNHDAFLNMLKQIEHEVMFENNQESDWFYDTPQRTMTQQGKSLVLREIQPAGIKLWIVKGPEADRCEATNITKLDSAQKHGLRSDSTQQENQKYLLCRRVPYHLRFS